MIGTITPLVKVAPGRWLRATAIYAASGVFSGLAVGALAAGIVSMLVSEHERAALTALAAVIGVAYGIGEVAGRHLPLPSVRRSVPQEWWIRHGSVRASAMYGAILGLGVTTVVRYPGLYLAFVLAILSGSSLAGGLTLAAYATIRALPVLAAAVPVALGVPVFRLTDLGLGHLRALRAANGAALVFGAALVLLM